MLDWLVLADDRTGALEVAGAIADRIGASVGVVTRVEDIAVVAAADGAASVVVVDISTRHLSAEDASVQLAHVATTVARRWAYKLDSTLRGGWAADVVRLADSVTGRVVVIPAFPAMGRTCLGGVVHLHGRPLEVDDARSSMCSPAPAAHLVAAGVRRTDIAELRDPMEIGRWTDDLSGVPRFAVCDAQTDDDLVAIGRALAGHDRLAVDEVPVVVGTSASVAATVAADVAVAADGIGQAGSVVAIGSAAPRFSGFVGGPTPVVLVVCGSLHPMARSQVAALRSAARVEVAVITAGQPSRLPVGSVAARRVASDLAGRSRHHLGDVRVDAVIVVGGDTAAAVLGPAPRLVGGVVGTGMPWSIPLDESGPVVVTKAGGFGTPDTLVDLIDALAGGTR